MTKHPTLVQFSQHPCIHWEMRENEEYCTMFGKTLDDHKLHCSPQCSAYEPWDCDIEELRHELLKGDQTRCTTC